MSVERLLATLQSEAAAKEEAILNEARAEAERIVDAARQESARLAAEKERVEAAIERRKLRIKESQVAVGNNLRRTRYEEELRKTLFDMTGDRFREFIKTSGYKEWLANEIAEVTALYGAPKRMEADPVTAAVIRQLVSTDVTIEEEETIIGYCLYTGGGKVMIDGTFDGRINKVWPQVAGRFGQKFQELGDHAL